MKQIINGKIYDTETATEVCGYQYSNRSDFNYCYETLYHTKKGAWFLYGEGGPNSKYSQMVGQNEWSGGEGIRALSEDEARQFIEAHASADVYTNYFHAEEA